MGLFTPIYSENGASIEYAVLSLLDLRAQREQAPGLDDVMEEPFLVDDGSGVGARNRPTIQVTLRCKIEFTKSEAQTVDQVGNDPDSEVKLTLYEADLIAAGLLVDGKSFLKADDRLIRIVRGDGIASATGQIRVDFAHDGRVGLRCYEVRPGTTGEGVILAMFESQRASQIGIPPS